MAIFHMPKFQYRITYTAYKKKRGEQTQLNQLIKINFQKPTLKKQEIYELPDTEFK